MPQTHQAIGIIPATLVNYLLNSYWTFKEKPKMHLLAMREKVMKVYNNQKPKTLLTNGLCAAIILFFLIFLIIAGENARINYDAAHNLTPYQSMFNGTGFSFTYNGWTVAFPSHVSSGPEVYLPAFFLWKMFGYVNYEAAIWVLIAYYIIFLVLLSWIVFDRPLDRLMS